VGKRPFVDGSKTFDLRGAFPDFDFHEHDFRVDKVCVCVRACACVCVCVRACVYVCACVCVLGVQ
jgi:hypothetical protein